MGRSALFKTTTTTLTHPTGTYSDNMQENFKKFYKPTLFFFIVVIFIMAIAGAAITAAPSDVEELQAGEVATMLSEVKSSLKTAQDLFIATIVFSLFALFLGGASHMGHGSNSTKYEVNEKRDKEKKGVDNSGFDGKRPTLRRVTRRMRSGKITTCLMTRNQRRKSPANCDIQCKIFLQMTSKFVVTFIFMCIKKFVSLEIKHENP